MNTVLCKLIMASSFGDIPMEHWGIPAICKIRHPMSMEQTAGGQLARTLTNLLDLHPPTLLDYLTCGYDLQRPATRGADR